MIDTDRVAVLRTDMLLETITLLQEDVAILVQDPLMMIVADVAILALVHLSLINSMLEDIVVPLLPVKVETCVLVPH